MLAKLGQCIFTILRACSGAGGQCTPLRLMILLLGDLLYGTFMMLVSWCKGLAPAKWAL